MAVWSFIETKIVPYTLSTTNLREPLFTQRVGIQKSSYVKVGRAMPHWKGPLTRIILMKITTNINPKC